MNMKSIRRPYMPVFAAALAFSAVSAFAHPSTAVTEDRAQLTADKAALHRQIKRLEADEATLKSDRAAGRMSAESKDAYVVYQARQAIKGEKKDIAADKAASQQMKLDKAALKRQIKRLEIAEATLKTDKAQGKMAAESKDSEQVYMDRLAVKGEKKDIAADRARLKADEKK